VSEGLWDLAEGEFSEVGHDGLLRELHELVLGLESTHMVTTLQKVLTRLPVHRWSWFGSRNFSPRRSLAV